MFKSGFTRAVLTALSWGFCFFFLFLTIRTASTLEQNTHTHTHTKHACALATEKPAGYLSEGDSTVSQTRNKGSFFFLSLSLSLFFLEPSKRFM